jgi:hypothetical protein
LLGASLSVACCEPRRVDEPRRGTLALEFGIDEGPTHPREHGPWIAPTDASLRASWIAARWAFEAGFPDPVGRRYARCGGRAGFVVTIPGGVALLDWRGAIEPCSDLREVPPPFHGEPFARLSQSIGIDVNTARTNALSSALLLRYNTGTDVLTSASASPRARWSALESWARVCYEASLDHYFAEPSTTSEERALFFARAAQEAIGVYERTVGSTRGNPALWFAPIAASLARQLSARVEVQSSAHEFNSAATTVRDAGEEAANHDVDAGDAPFASDARERRSLIVALLSQRRRATDGALRERTSPSPASPLTWLTATMIERTADPSTVESLLAVLEHDDQLVPVRVRLANHADRSRPARIFEVAYAALAVTLAFDPLFEELDAQGDARPRVDTTASVTRFAEGDPLLRRELAQRFRARIAGLTLTRAALARMQLVCPWLAAIAPSAARRLPSAPQRWPTDAARRSELEARVRDDGALIVHRAEQLFDQSASASCGVLGELERVSPGFVSDARSALVERFATRAIPHGEPVACSGRTLRPRPGEDPARVEQRYERWVRAAGVAVFSASPCDTIAPSAERTLSTTSVRTLLVEPLESMRPSRGAGGALRALARWVRPDALRCARESPTFRDWLRAVLRRSRPIGYAITEAIRDGEPWGRTRRCAVVHEEYASLERRASLRDLVAIAYLFADTRTPCALATQPPSLDAARRALEAMLETSR